MAITQTIQDTDGPKMQIREMAHWGAQCQPEQGDWYDVSCMIEGSKQYNFHVKKYGHPSRFGFIDVINDWKAENWNPVQLWNYINMQELNILLEWQATTIILTIITVSYQPWNSVNMGPKKDFIGGWPKLPESRDCVSVLVFIRSCLAFYETVQRSIKKEI